MNLDRALQLNTAALALMGAVFLGLGQESPMLPLALGLAALASTTVTHLFRWLTLNRIIANLVALAAVAWSLRNFLSDVTSRDQLLAIADMLVYLQIVLLFQEKTGRVYWQLIVLSLLQVVVAAALYLGPQFGLLLAVYMALALSALVLLCLYHEWRRGGAGAEQTGAASGPAWQRLLARPQVAAAPGRQDVAAAAAPALLARQVALLGGATLLFAGVFFYAAPRLGEGAWSAGRGSAYSTTGLAPELDLEESGRVHLSNQLVMRATLSSMPQRQPYQMLTEPYFNGMALPQYVRDNSGSRWTPAPRPRIASATRRRQSMPMTQTSANRVRQEYDLEAGAVTLPVIVPVQKLPETPGDLFFASSAYRLAWRPASDDRYSLRSPRYAVATTSLRNGRQLHGVPHANPLLTAEDKLAYQEEVAALLELDEARFPALTRVAAQALRDEQVEREGPLDKALALERHFHEQGRYRYSLSLDFVRQRELDPIEDFVANHHTGHCEYFASALALMLRSQGIPARVIVGYKGGDFNSLGQYYQVRQKHSHAWVEALLPPGVTPAWELAGMEGAGGSWYRLDPTPSSEQAAGVSGENGVVDRVGETFDYVELLWRDYVLSLNAARQQDTIYDPVSSHALASFPAWLESRSVHRLIRRVAAQLGWDVPVGGRDASSRVVDWRTGSAVIGLLFGALVLLQAIVLAVQLVRRLVRGRSSKLHAAVARPQPPRFYRRYQSLLGRMQLRRAAGQTARELAAAASLRLDRGRQQPAAALLPERIVAEYYRVRFGGATLDSRQQAAIEQALVELAPAVHAAAQPRS